MPTNAVKTYKELQLELRILKAELQEMEYHRDKARTTMFTGDKHRNEMGDVVYVPLDRAKERHDRLCIRCEELAVLIATREQVMGDILSQIALLTGLDNQVAKLHHIDGMTLKQVADKLGYSYDHIRRVHRRCHNDATELLQNL